MKARGPLKEAVRPLLSFLRKLWYSGRTVHCPCCDGWFRRFRNTGTPRRVDATCPQCGAEERHRRLALYALRNPGVLQGRVLHIAPERAMSRILRRSATLYVTLDLTRDRKVKVQADVTGLPWRDGSWDTIVCSHVLEHVSDDRQAMRELYRVLAPQGRAVVIVPQDADNPHTIEDPEEVDPLERTRRFGQADHVRLYGLDIVDRLALAGFEVESLTLERFSPDEVEQCRLNLVNAGSDDAILICS